MKNTSEIWRSTSKNTWDAEDLETTKYQTPYRNLEEQMSNHSQYKWKWVHVKAIIHFQDVKPNYKVNLIGKLINLILFQLICQEM